MFKKVLLALGVAFLLFIGLIVALMFWARQKSGELQDKFFAAVESGDPQQVIAMLLPEVRTDVDAPVLGAWMQAMTDNLGPYKGLELANFRTSTKYENGKTHTESVSDVDFAKGSAHSELVYVDGQLAGFNVHSLQLPVDWFKGPTSTELYRSRGQEFLEDLLGDKLDAAIGLMDPKPKSRDELKQLAEATSSKMGPLKAVKYQSEKVDKSNGYDLELFYDLQGEHGAASATVKFHFNGMNGRISTYTLTTIGK